MRLSEIICAERNLLTTPIFDISNVAAYWDALPEARPAHPRDLPCVVPPMPEMLLDVHFHTMRLAIHVESVKRPPQVSREEPMFLCSADMYYNERSFEALHLCKSYWCTDDEGGLTDVRLGMSRDDYRCAFAIHVFTMSLLALSFMHCKNVVQRTFDPAPALARKQQRRYGVPKLTYRVLVIEPMTRRLREEGHVETEGLARALHICRGHFKTYRADAPLFGQRVGTWWWEAAARGAKEAGMVIKDYRVARP